MVMEEGLVKDPSLLSITSDSKSPELTPPDAVFEHAQSMQAKATAITIVGFFLFIIPPLADQNDLECIPHFV
jgi:hypothetical protein